MMKRRRGMSDWKTEKAIFFKRIQWRQKKLGEIKLALERRQPHVYSVLHYMLTIRATQYGHIKTLW